MVSFLRTSPYFRKTLYVVILSAPCLLSVCARAANCFTNAAPPQQQAQSTGTASQAPQVLELNSPFKRELAGGQKHIYRITLAAGQFVNVLIEQRGIDVIVRAFGVDDKLVGEWDSEIRLNGRETAGLVSEAPGSFRLEIEAKYKTAASGGYEVVLNELREANNRDRLLEEARTLHGEANRLIAAGKYDQALPILEKSLQIRQANAGPDHIDTARSMMLMANLRYYTDDFGRAEQLYSSAATVFEKRLGPLHPLLATCLNNLASLYQATGNLTKSEVLHRRALAIRETELPRDHPDIAQSLNNLANVYRTKGDYATAEPLYSRALHINEKTLGPDHINLASPLNNLAQLHKEMGDYDKAEGLFQRSLKLREEKLGPDHPEVSAVLTRLGVLYYEKHDYPAAEAAFQRAQSILEKRHGPTHSEIAAVLNNLGRMYHRQNDYATAESFYQRALAMKEATLGAQHPDTVTTLDDLAELYFARGDLRRAVDFQTRAAAVTEHNISLNLGAGSERQKLAYFASQPTLLHQIISLQVRSAEDPRARDLAITTVLRRKGRVLDAMSESLAALRRRFSAADQSLLDQLNAATAQLSKLVLNGPQKKTPAEHQARIRALEEQRDKLEAEISGRGDGLYRESQPVTLAGVQAAIPNDAALIEFATYRPVDPKAPSDKKRFGAPHYVAYVVRNHREVQWRELGSAKEIDDAIERWRKALGDPKRKDAEHFARAVDEEVMRPIRPLLGNATHLLISPAGVLNLVPFEAMVDEQGRYLVETYSFSYLTSGRDLLRLEVARASKGESLVIADPQFDQPALARVAKVGAPVTKRPAFGRKRQGDATGDDLANVYFAPLHGTAKEARVIKSLFAEANIVTGTQATESTLKKAAAPRILHIATHGFFLTDTASPSSNAAGEPTRAISEYVKVENPLLRSGLALAGANLRTGSNDDDGILTALEASGLNLWGTKLVTLSACDTGLGEVKNSEGVYGLRRAFVLAGAETLVMSLWRVSDYVTREMMSAYYKGLRQGVGRGEALRQAKLATLKQKGRQHPYYWASFIQSGEWANLEGKR